MAFTPSENPITNPTRESYTELRPFRFWCQKVLPLVYDDSLSYYELLCKVVDYLNKTMEDVDHMNTDMDTLYSNFQAFQEGTIRIYNELVAYVNTYFDELDVQEEINTKLDEMAQDGSLLTIIQPLIASEISEWLENHITPTTPVIDSSLTVSGAGADAKTVGDIFRSNLTIKTLPSNNLNEVLESGIYLIPTGTVLENAPNVILPCILFVEHFDSAISQQLLDYYYGTSFVRRIIGTNYSTWNDVFNLYLCDAFNINRTYRVNEYVNYRGDFYRCIREHTGNFNASNFSRTKIGIEFTNTLKYTGIAGSGALTDINYTSVTLLPTGYNYTDAPHNLILPSLMFTVKVSDSLLIQTIYDYNNSNMWTRRKSGSNVSNWKSKDFDTPKNTTRIYKPSKSNLEKTSGGYYRQGTFVTDDNLISCYIPFNGYKWLCNSLTNNIEYLDSNKNYISDIEYTSRVVTMNGFTGGLTRTNRITELKNYGYLNVIVNKNNGLPVCFCDNIIDTLFTVDDDNEYNITVNNGNFDLKESTETKNSKNYVIRYNGELDTTSSNTHTDLMFVKKGGYIDCTDTALSFRLVGFSNNANYFTDTIKHFDFEEDTVFYLDVYVGTWYYNSYTPNITKYEMPYFIRVCNSEFVRNNKYKGLTWYCYGTSISDIGIHDAQGNNGDAGKYPLTIDNMLQMERHNGAIGSGGYVNTHAQNRYVTANVLTTPHDADLVTLEVLPNDDFYNSAVMGEIGDTGYNTLCGAISNCLEYLTTNTKANIYLLFVTWRIVDFDFTDDNSYVNPVTATNRIKYRNAVEKLKEICKIFGVRYIDVDKSFLEWGKRLIGVTYRDHIHLNYLGGEIAGRYIVEKLLEENYNRLDIPD